MDDHRKLQRAADSPHPSEVEVVKATAEIEHATQQALSASSEAPAVSGARRLWLTSALAAVLAFSLLAAVLFSLAWGTTRAARRFLSSASGTWDRKASVALHFTTDPALQAEVEELLGRIATGDSSAVTEVLEMSGGWTGKIESTPKTQRFITSSLNLPDLRVRSAALQAQLAINGITRDASGFRWLEQHAGNPQYRAFALWMLGALGNRGVDPAHAAKIIGSYLDDPDVGVRSNAVMGLALLGTDETVPMLLDRFRHDPSVTVQELAACGLAQSGMYTHPQRMAAARTLAGWVDDALLSAQQRAWAVQALHDISGQNFGTDSAAWRRWYRSNS